MTESPRRASIRRVAEEAGVSVSTVSNVLNKPHLVATETRLRVESVMDEFGFVRNGAARQLRGVRSPVVGCVVLDISNAFFAEVTRGVQDRLAEADCMIVLCSTDVRESRETHYLRLLEEQGVRGILVNPVSPSLDRLKELSKRGTPVVLIDHRQDDPGLCTAAVDNVRGGQLAADHLLELGHRRIVYLNAEVDLFVLGERREGIRRAVAAAGGDAGVVEVRIPPPANADGADQAVERVLALSPRPTGIICFNDTAALGVLRGLGRHGLAVPRDMSVVGYDDVQFAACLSPPLTTVRQPRYELGRAAAELLLSESTPDHEHQERIFRPVLVVRGSTGPPAGG
ncbi:MAG TPA: LacI family DNA-binding transcriptional regulator [Pilimelia sp.]|nr:LacI family DNA-binding transcriptional regulator [Pilimelia sp.]